MKKFFLTLLALCLLLSCAAAIAEEKTENSFAWNGYQLHFVGTTTDMEAYGIPSFKGTIAAVRLSPVEGTIKESDFKQQLFVLVDPEGNEHSCQFFVLQNNEKNAMGIHNLNAEQEFIDLLFELGSLTEENIHLSSVAVRETKEAEPVMIPLSAATETITAPKSE